MALSPKSRIRCLLAGSALTLSLMAAPLSADTIFTATSDGFQGMVRAGGAGMGAPVYPGSKAVISGDRLVPGQQITLMRGATALNKDPIVADEKGKFSFELTVDDDAATGLQPIVVIAEKPAAATVTDLKISPLIPVQGAENFTVKSEPVSPGLYQVAYSAASDAVFVASAVGRPPVKQSKLLKLNPETLEILAEITPAEAPMPPRPEGAPPAPGNAPAGAPPAPGGGQGGPQGPGVYAVYGVAVDDANGTVWATNTRQNTVAVYKQSDLSLIKQFEPGSVTHSRDVVVDAKNGRAYVSSVGGPGIAVFDTKSLEKLDAIKIQSGVRGEEFSAMALDLDAAAGKLVTVSMTTNEAAVIDLASGEVKVLPLAAARGASGIAYDAKDDLLFVASQQSDNLLIVKADTGETVADVEVGAGPLNVAFEPVNRLAYVANRGSGTITVVDTAGKIVANLDAGTLPNQLRADGKGDVFAVNKSRGEDDPNGDRLWRIAPVAK
ncbi:MAG: YncE family protein [Paracoccaceae bacterium]